MLLPGSGAGLWRYRRITGRACACSGCRTRPTGWRRLRRRCCWRGNWSRPSTATATATVPGAVHMDALAVCRRRCWAQDWVLDLDVRAFFDSVPHSLLMKAVAHHTSERWVLLYISRWLTAPMQMPDGTVVPREKGTPQGSPISPLLANLFMHYAFDTWMDREFPGCPFERYADDIVAHCDSEDQARELRVAIAERLGTLGLELHPAKTKIVFCKDANRRGDFGAHQLRFPRLYLPGPSRQGAERLFHWLQPGYQREGEEGERPADQGLAPQPAQQRGPARPRRTRSTRKSEAGSTTTGPSTAPSCVSSHGGSTSTSPAGPCRNSSDSAASTPGRWSGCRRSTSTSQTCSPTGS